jgi:Fe2+ or Zn2+ uptake regulation protein
MKIAATPNLVNWMMQARTRTPRSLVQLEVDILTFLRERGYGASVYEVFDGLRRKAQTASVDIIHRCLEGMVEEGLVSRALRDRRIYSAQGSALLTSYSIMEDHGGTADAYAAQLLRVAR